ncbi:MAG: PEP-CTERM sorting domain-containing protein [Alphaproteobacteria bacterium]|nr:PEP-CTERM sorting domain-containing protein [Alphaproteobacteria bacterium]
MVNNESKYDPDTRDWYSVALGDMLLNETHGADLVPPDYAGSGGAGFGEAQNFFQLNVYDIMFNPAALAGHVVNFAVWAISGYEQILTGYEQKITGYVQILTGYEQQRGGNPRVCRDNLNRPIYINGDPIYVSSPSSHDGQWRQVADNVQVPEPASMTMFFAGLLGLGWLTRFRRDKHKA